MKRLPIVCLASCVAVLLLAAPAARAESFGLGGFKVTFADSQGKAVTQAGAHPFAMRTAFTVNTRELPGGTEEVEVAEPLKDLEVAQIPGFAGDPDATTLCPGADFLTQIANPHASGQGAYARCPDASAIGYIGLVLVSEGTHQPAPEIWRPVYNLEPGPGEIARIGFWASAIPVTVSVGLSGSAPYRVVARVRNASQVVEVLGADLVLWGDPGATEHNALRGTCVGGIGSAPSSLATCPGEASGEKPPFLITPRACRGSLLTNFRLDSWEHPGTFVEGSDAATGEPPSFTACEKLGFSPSVEARPTSLAATSPSGLDFSLDTHDEESLLSTKIEAADSDIEKAVVTLPEGMTTNPSSANGLSACSEGQLAEMNAFTGGGTGCPDASKLGNLEVESPLLAGKVLPGSLFLAEPYDNPEHTLIALYAVIQDPELGIFVIQPLRVEPNPVTGRLTTTAEDMPQLPFSHFRLHFREGARSPLVTPPTCGPEQVEAELYPYAGGAPIESTSAFEVISGPNGGPCPAGGLPPFHPNLQAGTLNNAAGSYSPFNVDISRTDSEQEMTNFSIKLPPGITGKLAGIPECSDPAIAAAKTRERTPHGGQEEIERPSCPAASQVGRTLAGAGVGPTLTYVPGKVYLAGPYHGAPLSIVSITAATAGPFDLGTVVVRYALKINPETAEVFVDATGSDPLPHIVDGIPVHLRDVRAYVDRPGFVLNPTGCERTSTASTVLGSGLDFASPSDDVPVTVTSPFQAADCASLPYKPALALKLKGGTKRGKDPQLTAILRPRPGDANSQRLSVLLPHSEFLDQSHIKTICTRVQFKAGDGNGSACPPGSIYGTVKAWTPLLENPLQGNVYLRSSDHPLPDLVLALHGQVEFTEVGRIDSVKGGIRNTFETVPDAPITKVELAFQGGKKGLLVNSTDICRGKHQASLEYTAHSGRRYDAKTPLKARCRKTHKTKEHKK